MPQKIEETLKNVNKWCAENNLLLYDEKTKLSHFHTGISEANFLNNIKISTNILSS